MSEQLSNFEAYAQILNLLEQQRRDAVLRIVRTFGYDPSGWDDPTLESMMTRAESTAREVKQQLIAWGSVGYDRNSSSDPFNIQKKPMYHVSLLGRQMLSLDSQDASASMVDKPIGNNFYDVRAGTSESHDRELYVLLHEISDDSPLAVSAGRLALIDITKDSPPQAALIRDMSNSVRKRSAEPFKPKVRVFEYVKEDYGDDAVETLSADTIVGITDALASASFGINILGS